MILLELENVCRNFGGLRAVDDLSFQVEKREIFGLIGPNGAGKTTIFNLINNFVPVTSGRIYFQNLDITGLKPHNICKLGIGRSFQVVRPLGRMTVLENVITAALCRTERLDYARTEALEMLDFCGLLSEKDKLGRSLSIGNRKLLEIARAMATKPQVLLLDEPAGGLNPRELDEVIALIRKIRDRGITILIVEHIMKVIMSISDRILAINYGAAIASGTPREVANNEKVIEAYLGKEYA